MAGRKTVRPIHISDYSFILLYRFEGSQESSPTSDCARARQQVEAGTARRTLKTAQGRHSERGSNEKPGFQSLTSKESDSQIRLSSHLNSLRNGMIVEARSSEEERRVDAKALIADEGRDKLRKVLGSCK